MDIAEAEQKYDFDVVRWFSVATVIYLVVGTLVGVYIAAELAWPALNFDSPYLSFGRLRPLHTNAVIFAFGGCVLMGTAFYTVQRTCGVRLWSNKLAWFTFWGWNLVIVLAVITLPLGFTQGKEYAELEWPIDILIAVVWVAFTINFIMTIAIRKSSHIYVSNWFYLGMMVMITYLHVVNSLAIPVDQDSRPVRRLREAMRAFSTISSASWRVRGFPPRASAGRNSRRSRSSEEEAPANGHSSFSQDATLSRHTTLEGSSGCSVSGSSFTSTSLSQALQYVT